MAKSSDIISIAVGETWRHAGMVAKASGSAITAGTVNYYLKAKSGANVGKWWNNGDQTWAASETANAMSHDADGNWTIELAASPFTDGVLYLEYAKESGDLHVAGEGKLLRGQANPFNGITSLADWLGALAGKTADTATRAEINATTAGAGYNETEDSAEAIRDRGDAAWITGSAGTGTYACTWTVNDGSTALQGATVSFWLAGVLRGTGTTNASGQVSMSLDAGTYTVAISLSGYTFANTTHAVSATASTWTKTFSMTSVVWPSSTVPGTTTVRWRVRKTNRAWAGADDCTVYMGISKGPGVAGTIYNGDNLDYDSDATDSDGYVYFANTPKGSTVAVKTATDGQVQFVKIPADCGDTFEGLELIGSA